MANVSEGKLSLGKLRGEWAELRFMARAAEQGFRVIKPWGDCSRYDFAVESGGRFSRIQVKATSNRQDNHYSCTVRRAGRKRYQDGEIDLFAIYVIPLDIWYLIPYETVKHLKTCLTISPYNSVAKHAQFREAWHLLEGETPLNEVKTQE
jgi:hypothetical protein